MPSPPSPSVPHPPPPPVPYRMILRTRVVFLKQTLGWMLHGTLHDPGSEFFIQSRQVASTTYRTGAAPIVTDGEGFDWASTFALRLDILPESHVSARLAAKIMFVGKAVRLLKQFVHEGGGGRAGLQQQQYSEGEQEILSYFGGNGGRDWVLDLDTEGDVKGLEKTFSMEWTGSEEHLPGMSHTVREALLTPVLDRHTAQTGNGLFEDGKDEFKCDTYVLEVLREQHKHWTKARPNSRKASLSSPVDSSAQGGGLQLLQHCASVFEDILCKPDVAIDLFEQLVEDLHDLSSELLWGVLQEHSTGPPMDQTELTQGESIQSFRCGFFEYLHFLRNVFLLGKGEFYQVCESFVHIELHCTAPPP